MSRRDLTGAALVGYMGEPCPFLATSPSWYAYKLGAFLKASGRAEPTDVAMSRGDSVRCRDMLFKPNADASSFERLR